MAEEMAKHKGRRIGSALGTAALVLVLMAVIYIAAVLLQTAEDGGEGSWVVVEDQAPLSRMQSASMSDLTTLAQLFGAPLPTIPGYFAQGEGANALYDGQNARVATLRYEGVTVTAVRPASAAPLLLRQELSVSLRNDLTVLNLPAVLAEKGGAYCLYFSSEDAAYAIYAPRAQEQDLLSLADRLAWAQ